MYRFGPIIIIILSFIFFLSCKDNNIVENNNENIIFFPMEVGYRWIYSTTIYDSTNQMVINKYLDTIKITSKLELGKITYYFFNQFPWITKSEGRAIIFTSIDSNIVVSSERGNFKNMKFKINSNTGDTIHYFNRVITMIDNNFELNTVIGNFYCKVYQSNLLNYKDDSNPFNHYLSPGTGLVKFEQFWKHLGKFNLIKSMTLIQKDSIPM